MSKYTLLFLVPFVTSCSTIGLSNLPKETVRPLLSGSNLDSFQCSRNKIKILPGKPKLFFVSDIPDGTINRRVADGALSDSGQLQLKSSLSELIPRSAGLISDLIPNIFRAQKGGGINIYGSIGEKTLSKYTSRLKRQFNGSTPNLLLIKGAFTRFDANPKEQYSNGISGGNKGSDGDGNISFGKAYRKNSISLTINIIDPTSNIILTTQSFIADTENRERDLKIRFGPGEGAIGYTNKFNKSLTPHEIQQHLIDVAALWIVNKAYPEAQIKSCLPKEKSVAITDIK